MALCEEMMTTKVKAKYSFGFCLQKQHTRMSSDAERKKTQKNVATPEISFFLWSQVPTENNLATVKLRAFSLLILFYFNPFSLFNLAAKLLCRDFKIQVLPAAFYLNENVNFKQSAASGKVSTQGCCC